MKNKRKATLNLLAGGLIILGWNLTPSLHSEPPASLVESSWQAMVDHALIPDPLTSNALAVVYNKTSSNADIRSEGNGYGMVLAAARGDRQIFDQLRSGWKHYVALRDAVIAPGGSQQWRQGPGLMPWRIRASDGQVMDWEIAPDGDLDIAYALLIAAEKWGQPYRDEARAKIRALEYVIDSETFLCKPGVNWGGGTDSSSNYITSYFMTGYFRAFAREMAGTAEEDFWLDVVDAHYDWLENKIGTGPTPNRHPLTHLNHFRVRFNGDTNGANYNQDAFRLPWRIACDTLWFDHPRARAHNENVLYWVKQKYPNQDSMTGIGNIYTVAGEGPQHNWGEPSTAAVWAVVAHSLGDQTHASMLWNEAARRGFRSTGGYWNLVTAMCVFSAAGLLDLEGTAPPPSDGLTSWPTTGVSANRYESPNIPAHTRDGDLSTRWAAEGADSAITFDLGQTRDVRQLNIAWFRGNERRYSFSIRTSSDGSTWQTVFNGQSSGSTSGMEVYAFDPVSARHVGIVSSGSNVNTWTSIFEVEILGQSATAPPGEPGLPQIGETIALRADNGKFIVPDFNGTSVLVANRDSVGPWETYDVLDAQNGNIYLRSGRNGRFVCAHNFGNDPLVADRLNTGSWEVFRFELVSNGVVLRANVNGRYVVRNSNNTLTASATSSSGATVFQWEGVDGWTSQDIGSTSPSGSTSISGDLFTVRGAGDDI